MRTIQLLALPCALSLSAATDARTAQTSEDTSFSPFRKGQWAAQFGASPSFVSLGFLRFTSEKRAWLLDARFNLTESDGESRVTIDTVTQTSETRSSIGSFSTRIGRRFYPTLGDRTAGSFTIGASGGYGRSTRIRSTDRFRVSTWSVGIFGDVGADYLLTHKLSIGGSFGLRADYFSRDTDVDAASGNTLRDDENIYRLTLGGASLVLSLYF